MFIIYSNYNALFVNKIINENNYKNPIIIDYTNSNLFKKTNNYYSSNKILKWILFHFKIRFFTNFFLKKNKIRTIVFSNTGGILSNFLFNNKKIDVEFNLMFEGILTFNFFNKKLNTNTKPSLKKKIISIMFFYFLKKSDLLPINSKKINSLYVPKLFQNYFKNMFSTKSINLTFGKIRESKKSLLFIGNDWYLDRNKIFKKLNEIILKYNIKKVFYKPHQNEKNFKEIIEFNKEVNFIFLDQKTSIENQIQNFKSSYLVSNLSSAFLNLLNNNSNIKFITIVDINTLDSDLKKLVQLFRKLNIEVKYV